MKRLIVGLILAWTSAGYAQTKCAPSLPSDVCKFEERVYTATDFKNTEDVRQMMVEFKALLMAHANDPALVQDHILTLGGQIVEEAYSQRAPKAILALADGKGNLLKMLKHLRAWEKKNGRIVPLDWKMPEGVVIGVTSLDRVYDVSTDRLRYGITVFAALDRPIDVEELKISRFGGSVVIDKSAGIGSWHQDVLPQSNYLYFNSSSIPQDTPVADGLYLLSIKVKGQSAVDGWFFLHGTSSTSPVLQEPQVNGRYRTANPTFKFQDFKTNFLSPTDSRKVSISVHQEVNGQVWKSSTINPSGTTSLTLGREKNQSGAESIPPGNYWLHLAFEERSYFGDLTIGRLARTTVRFSVAP